MKNLFIILFLFVSLCGYSQSVVMTDAEFNSYKLELTPSVIRNKNNNQIIKNTTYKRFTLDQVKKFLATPLTKFKEWDETDTADTTTAVSIFTLHSGLNESFNATTALGTQVNASIAGLQTQTTNNLNTLTSAINANFAKGLVPKKLNINFINQPESVIDSMFNPPYKLIMCYGSQNNQRNFIYLQRNGTSGTQQSIYVRSGDILAPYVASDGIVYYRIISSIAGELSAPLFSHPTGGVSELKLNPYVNLIPSNYSPTTINIPSPVSREDAVINVVNNKNAIVTTSANFYGVDGVLTNKIYPYETILLSAQGNSWTRTNGTNYNSIAGTPNFNGGGYLLKSANGTCFTVTVNNTGALQTTQLTSCP